MSGHDITTGFMIATAVMFLVCWVAVLFRKEAMEIAGAGAVVFLFTMVSRMWSASTDMPLTASPWPLQDLICGTLALVLFHKHREWWKFALAACFGAQCGAHVIYWWFVLSQGPSRDLTVNYLWVINPLFAGELLVLTAAGGQHIADHVLDRLQVLLSHGAVSGQGVARGR